MRKRITRFSLPRRLASRWGGETCELFDPSSTESRADTFSTATGTPNLQDAGIQLFPGLTPVNELEAEIQDAFSVEVTAGAAARLFRAETGEQVTPHGKQASRKRRSEDAFGEEDWGKLLILEVPLDDGQLQPASPLDPELDALIDAVLHGSENPLDEPALSPADEPQISELLDLAVGSWPTTLAAASGLDGRAPSSNVDEEP
ncbi:hypothetical protein EAH_00060600, partial [Eimeria acervulina]